MFGHSRTRSADQTRDIAVAERDLEQRAARILDTKIRTQLQQRHPDALMKTHVRKARTAQQQPVPVFQVIVVERFKYRVRGGQQNAVEIRPAQAADSTIAVRFTAE